MTVKVLRFDAGSLAKPRRTSQGYLRVDGWAARAGTQEYRNPDGSKRIELRDDDAVFDDVALQGFEGAPVTDDHPPVMVDLANAKSYTKGTVLSVGRRDGDHVAVSLVITDPDLIRKVESGKRQLSTGYYVELDETPGTHPKYGRYDARQVRVGPVNHLALVDRGRAGTAAVRMDAAVDVSLDDESHWQRQVEAWTEWLTTNEIETRLDAIAKRLDTLAKKRTRKDGEWNEEDHPRDEQGRFGAGGGGGGSKKESGSGAASAPKSAMPDRSKGQSYSGDDEHFRDKDEEEDLFADKPAASSAMPDRSKGQSYSGDDEHFRDKDEEDLFADTPPKKERVFFAGTPSETTGDKISERISKLSAKEKEREVKDLQRARERTLGALGYAGNTPEQVQKYHKSIEDIDAQLGLYKSAPAEAKPEGAKRAKAKKRDSAQSLHIATGVPNSDSRMDLEAALARIKELEAKLDAFEAAPADGPKCESCGEAMGEDHKCAPKMDAADVARLEADLELARKDAEDAKTAATTAAQAHADELAKVRKDADDSVTKKVRESVDVMTKARAVLGTDAKIKLDGKDTDLLDAPVRAVKCAVVKHVTGKVIEAAKHDAYVEGLFEAAVEKFSTGANANAAARALIEAPREDKAETPVVPSDPEKAALEANKNRISSAWMAETSK